MPRTKSASTPAKPKKTRAAKKTAPRTIRPRKKTKSVLVDIIEDEPITSGEGYDFQEKAARPKPVPEELDQQKRFYSTLATEISSTKDEEAEEGAVQGKRRSVGLYRRLVIKFVVLVLILACAVAYFSFAKLTVAVTLKGEPVSDTLLLRVADESAPLPAEGSLDPRQDISGNVREVTTRVTRTYSASGETYLGQEVSGRVRIINNYNRNQPLVASTRLLSADNKLYRLRETVTVPAGGEVSVEVYADKPSAEMAIGPTNFTIPGLWAGLQDRIYARNDEPFVYTQRVRKHVNASDLQRATQDISNALLQTAQEEASSTLPAADGWLYVSAEPAAVELGAKSGDQVEEFTATASGRVVAVTFPRAQAARLAAAKLNLIVPDDKELTEFRPENINYSVENYDHSSRTATIRAVVSGTMVLKRDADIIDPEQLANLSEEQLRSYLRSQPAIKEFDLRFSPGFVKKAPSLVDRIEVVIKKD